MKRVILIMSVFFMSQGLMAQTSTGDIFAGGTFQFTTSGGENSQGANSVEKNKNTSFTAIPQIGFFLSDQLAVGAGVGYSLNKTTAPGGDYNSNNTLIFAPFARYYMPVNEQINFFGQAGVGLNIGGSKNVTGNTETDTGDVFGLNLGLRAGVAFFPSEHINIDFGFNVLNFNTTKVTNPQFDPVTEDVTNSFTFGFNSFAPSIGINYFF